jgi:hypothetical protein
MIFKKATNRQPLTMTFESCTVTDRIAFPSKQ